MATIICKQCGYENPEGTTVCEICAEVLIQKETKVQEKNIVPSNIESTAIKDANSNVEYFVMCPESSTKTKISNPNIKSYFCEGCQQEHIIDGVIWTVESREKAPSIASETKTEKQECLNNLWLEEINTHFRIDIQKPGGTLGRYGDFGADYFQSRSMNTVSGEHCLIKYEFDQWVLYHVSRTNQTKYNGMILVSNEPTLLENGKTLTLANTVTFVVRLD